MSDDRPDQGNSSRYMTKKILGEYPPWRGYGVTDSFSEKNYLRFSLLPGESVALSLVDLQMRDALFTDDTILSTLSLEKNNGEISFLLPHMDLIPLTKALPSMKPQKSAETTRALFTTLLSKLTGYSDPIASAATLAAPDGTEIELAEFRHPRGRASVEKRWEDAGLSFLTLACDDLDAVVARLTAAGTRFVSDIVDYGLEDGAVVRVVYCFAPEGTTITLIQLPRGRDTLAAPRPDSACNPSKRRKPARSQY